jgi:hypothetical protein
MKNGVENNKADEEERNTEDGSNDCSRKVSNEM